jgi:hypothetical protein
MIEYRFRNRGRAIEAVLNHIKTVLELVGDTETKIIDFEVFEGFDFIYGSLKSLFNKSRNGKCYRIQDLFPDSHFSSEVISLNSVIELCETDSETYKYLFFLCVEEQNISWESTIHIKGPEKYSKLISTLSSSIHLVLADIKVHEQVKKAEEGCYES